MGRIPLNPTGNVATDNALRAIDEAISELFSQHGESTPRDNLDADTVTLRGDLGSYTALDNGKLYRDMQVIGMITSDLAGNTLFSKNIISAYGQNVSSRTSIGLYEYRVMSGTNTTDFLNGPISFFVIGVPTSLGMAGVVNVSATPQKTSAIRVDCSDYLTNAADVGHTVIAFGELPPTS